MKKLFAAYQLYFLLLSSSQLNVFELILICILTFIALTYITVNLIEFFLNTNHCFKVHLLHIDDPAPCLMACHFLTGINLQGLKLWKHSINIIILNFTSFLSKEGKSLKGGIGVEN